MQYKRVFVVKIISWILFLVLLTGCAKESQKAPYPAAQPDKVENGSLSDGMKANDTAVFVSYDEDEKSIRLINKENGKTYEVFYDKLTEFYDRYGKVSVIELFDAGSVVDIEVSVHSKTITRIQASPDAFIRRNIDRFRVNVNRGVLSAGEDNYRINSETPVFKGGKKLKASDISEGDTITITGMDRDIYSICITSGDGHVRILGTEFFEGGWVQIGKDIIKPVTEEMILDVPEGSYDMVVTYSGRGGTKHIDVERGKEITVDISDLKGELIKYGTLVFTIMPPDAKARVKINGNEIDYLQPQELEYGVYKIEVEAKGYIPIKENLSVGQEMANIQIELMESEEEEEEKEDDKPAGKKSVSSPAVSSLSLPALSKTSSSGSSTSTSSSTASAAEGISTTVTGKLYIDSPTGAEVYYDGAYKGVVPCSFSKTSGTHVVTLRRDGYRTKTYTITLDDTIENETYSFSDLIEE